MIRTTLSAAALLTALTGALGAQVATGLGNVTFLSGCWRGTAGPTEIREEWTDAAGAAMHYSTRFFRGGEVVDWEFGRMIVDEAEIVLWPYPRGVRSERGFTLVATGEESVFENLEHDFPVRIVYRRDGPNVLYPRIEGRDGERREWRLERVRCAG